MSEKLEKIVEELKSLTLLEASTLVKQIEETFGVDASSAGGMMMMAPGAVGGAEDGAAAKEKTEFDLVLDAVPADKKIAVLKVVRTITGLGLKEAKELVESAPKTLKEGIAKEEADSIQKQLEEAGATIVLK
uniref:Ribosomal protein L12 n=1 Tax=Olisthodiscus luteus TaxID=83000 RepID=A0A7U0QG96_OLILU|nr:ribosomal protein L12 [Olisthodiscus luteus]QQW50440.1 ribosomal protein L12 [Olisthodiscus luteus]